MDNNLEREQVSFNLAEKLSKIIYNHMTKAINSFVVGDWGTWFKNLEAIQEVIFMMLEEDEQDILDEVFKKCSKGHVYWKKWLGMTGIGHESPKELEIKVQDFAVNCKLYQRILMRNLKDTGFFPTKSQLQEVKLD